MCEHTHATASTTTATRRETRKRRTDREGVATHVTTARVRAAVAPALSLSACLVQHRHQVSTSCANTHTPPPAQPPPPDAKRESDEQTGRGGRARHYGTRAGCCSPRPVAVGLAPPGIYRWLCVQRLLVLRSKLPWAAGCTSAASGLLEAFLESAAGFSRWLLLSRDVQMPTISRIGPVGSIPTSQSY